jgi:hypothetical protein
MTMTRFRSSVIASAAVALTASIPLQAQTFSSHGYTTYAAGPIPEDLAITDLNGDSKLDIVVGNSNAGAPSGPTETVSVYLGTGDGLLTTHVQYGVGDRPEGVAVGLFDANSTKDVATADFEGNTVSILLGNGNGTFAAKTSVAVPGGPRFVIVGDFTGDSKTDLITANHAGDSVSVLQGAGNGTFTILGTTSVGNAPEVVAAGQLNGDAHLDLATCNNLDDSVTILHGNGAGVFTFANTIPVGDNPRFVFIADLNADGFGDILTANHTTGSVTIHRNNAGSSFSLQTTLTTSGATGPIYIARGDLDDDSIPDLAVTYAMSDMLGIYPGSGGFSFGPGELIATGDNPLGVALADLDDSGYLDVAVTNARDNNLYVYLSDTGLGTIPVDNTSPNTSKTGTWSVSGAAGAYGTNSLFATASAATQFTWNASLPAGTYSVYAWWTSTSNRNTSAPYTVIHSGGSTTVNVNQRLNGGQWNLLGTFNFSITGTVRVSANNSAVSTCADAVCFLPVGNVAPVATIDSITPSPSSFGQNVTFTGSGSDGDGTIVAYEWRSSINGVFGNQATVETDDLSAGAHIIFFRVQDDEGTWSAEDEVTHTVSGAAHTYILDNGDPGTSFTGTWSISGAPNPFGANSLFAKNGPTYTYDFTLASPGTYEVYAWWTQLSTRPPAAPYAITHSGGTTTVEVDQRVNGGQWNLLGSFTFDATARVRITAVGTTSTCADAICLNLVGPPVEPPTAVIDSIVPNPADVGESVTFTGHGEDPEARPIVAHEWRSSIDGALSTAASFTSSTLSAGTHTIFYRVQNDADVWSTEASQGLTVEGNVIIIDDGQPGTSFTGNWSSSGAPDPFGQTSLYARNGATYTYTFNLSSSGSYQVRAWWTEWPSRSTSVPIQITHSGGVTTVNVNQQIDGGQWNSLGNFTFDTTAVIKITAIGSPTTCADAMSLVGGGAPPPPQEVIIDNGQPGTTFTGNWSVSGASGFFGANSIYARNGPTYTYTANLTGQYEVFAWWTEWPSRTTAAPYDVLHSGGTTTVTVNQQANGGQWNSLGTYTFGGTAQVRIRAIGDPTTSADAVRFVPVP